MPAAMWQPRKGTYSRRYKSAGGHLSYIHIRWLTLGLEFHIVFRREKWGVSDRGARQNNGCWVPSVGAATAASPAAVALPLAVATLLLAVAPTTLAAAAASAQLAALHPTTCSTPLRMHLWRAAVSSGRAVVVLDHPGAHANLGCGGAAVPFVCVR